MSWLNDICIYIYIYIYILFISYIRDSQNFLEKIKTSGSVPENAILVTTDVVGLYPNIPRQGGLKVLKRALEKRDI